VAKLPTPRPAPRRRHPRPGSGRAAGLPAARSLARRQGILLAGSLALTTHVFVVNDWAGYGTDARDPRRALAGPEAHGVPRDGLALLAVALLAVAGALLAVLGTAAVALGAGIAALGLVYSLAPRLGKATPGAASLNHLVGGALHFLLGWTLVHDAGTEGVALSLFFGLVFAAGHLNQEVRDLEGDRANGIRTCAVAFGPRWALRASFALFTLADVLLLALATAGVLRSIVLVVAGVWALQAWWSLEALRRGPDAGTALWLQRRYRVLFAVVGLVLLVR
jgi:4-hydroxybenzoate polyprenyltransferase